MRVFRELGKMAKWQDDKCSYLTLFISMGPSLGPSDGENPCTVPLVRIYSVGLDLLCFAYKMRALWRSHVLSKTALSPMTRDS